MSKFAICCTICRPIIKWLNIIRKSEFMDSNFIAMRYSSSSSVALAEPSQLTANKLTAKQWFCFSDFITDFVTVISSQSESLGKMALGISVKINSGLPFSANWRCLRSVCLRSVGSQSVCRGQLSWTHFGPLTKMHNMKNRTFFPLYFWGSILQ